MGDPTEYPNSGGVISTVYAEKGTFTHSRLEQQLNGLNLGIDFLICRYESGRHSVGITAYNEEETPIGFKDFDTGCTDPYGMYSYGDKGNLLAKGLLLLSLSKQDKTDLIHRQIRNQALADSFYVDPEYRGKGIGKFLWFTAMRVSQLLGSRMHIVEQDESYKQFSRTNRRKSSFYHQFVPMDSFMQKNPIHYPEVYFPFDKETFDKLREEGKFDQSWNFPG